MQIKIQNPKAAHSIVSSELSKFNKINIIPTFHIGGPYICNQTTTTTTTTFTRNITRNIGSEISGNITLCGNPRPNVTWFIGDHQFNGTVDESMRAQHRYTYAFNGSVSSDMCGRHIQYTAVGHEEQGARNLSKVFIHQCNDCVFIYYR